MADAKVTRLHIEAARAVQVDILLAAVNGDQNGWRAVEQAFANFEAQVLAALAELLRDARWYVNDSLEAHEHSEGRELLNRIDAALSLAGQEAD